MKTHEMTGAASGHSDPRVVTVAADSSRSQTALAVVEAAARADAVELGSLHSFTTDDDVKFDVRFERGRRTYYVVTTSCG